MISVSQDVTLVANSGDINIFGQITGLTRNHFDANSQGGVTLNAAGSINLLSENADRLAIVFSSLDDLVIKTNGDLNNDTARLLSNSNTILHIKGDLNNLTSTTNSAPDIIITKTTRKYGNWLGWFGFKRHTTTHTINWGTARIPSQLSYIAGSTIAIDANNIDNSGEIDALSGALTLNASKITNRQFGTGSYFSFKNCGLTCWSKGTSDISFAGGQINANGSANLIAKQSISNRGSIVSYGNLTVTAPVVEALANYSPQIVNRPAGLYDFYSGARAIEITVPSGGTYLSPAGTLTINAMNPVTIDGGIVSGGVTTVITGGTNQLRTSSQYFSQSIHHIGVVGDIIP